MGWLSYTHATVPEKRRLALPGAGIALLGAAGQHPMATGMIMGGLCVPWFAQHTGRRSASGQSGCAIVALPRLYIIRQQSDCGQPALSVSAVALGSSEQYGYLRHSHRYFMTASVSNCSIYGPSISSVCWR